MLASKQTWDMQVHVPERENIFYLAYLERVLLEQSFSN